MTRNSIVYGFAAFIGTTRQIKIPSSIGGESCLLYNTAYGSYSKKRTAGMGAIKAGINGFGRIGRCVLRALAESGREDVQVVAINSRSGLDTAAHLLQYDSTHGHFGQVAADRDAIVVGGQRIRYTQNTDIGAADWSGADVQIVLECSGAFNSRQAAAQHLQSGAKRVLISAPARDVDLSVVYGVNHHLLSGDHQIVSAASCTTNCLAPVAKVLHDNFGIVRGWMSTVHAMTADQKLLDESHADLRRARSAAGNIIPTKTGAANSIGDIIPELRGKLDGVALRVPVANVSLLDFTCQVQTPASADEVNAAMQQAAKEQLEGVLDVSDAQLVSSDFNHNAHSAIVDSSQTRSADDFIKLFAWYDNEWGFANRMLDVAAIMMTAK